MLGVEKTVAAGAEFDMERLEKAVRDNRSLAARAIGAALRDARLQIDARGVGRTPARRQPEDQRTGSVAARVPAGTRTLE